VVEGARLESVYRGNSIEGSNPSLSAILLIKNELKLSPVYHPTVSACSGSRFLFAIRESRM
jgi:hypothetical protein